MKKVPISIIIDDPAPVISVYHEHADSPTTKDGRPLLPTFPNSMLFEFCDIVERHGIKGKFSVVPMPGNKGDIATGIDGADPKEVDEWLTTVKERLMPSFSICPEMLTHHKTVDLQTGRALDLPENEWSYTQSRSTLTPYIAHALSILAKVGIRSIGVTSPWDFGISVEDEYVAAISQAVKEVSGSDLSWYFLRGLRNVPNAKPWVALDEDGRVVVAIPSTTYDTCWKTIDSTDTSDAYVSRLADEWITLDGKDGYIIRVLQSGGYPIMVTHWQSLASNGLYTGLRVLDEVGSRVSLLLSDRVEWMSFEEIMHMVVADKESYHPRHFES